MSTVQFENNPLPRSAMCEL